MDDIENYKSWDVPSQMKLLENLLQQSQPEVKYRFQQRVLEFTRYNIIENLPIEIAEQIFLHCDLQTLLNCRKVSRSWLHQVNNSTRIWVPLLSEHCININFNSSTLACPGRKYFTSLPSEDEQNKNLQVIGESMFSMFRDISSTDEAEISTSRYCDASHFIMGKKIITSMANQASFQHIVDHDFRGSNIVMAMNEEILAYACEDRHIVVKYADFPNKKISVFEAHTCADLKIYGSVLISGGYDCTICVWDWKTGERLWCFEGSIKPVCSLDVIDDIIFSSDGSSVISWSMEENCMLKKSQCFPDERVMELILINTTMNNFLRSIYSKPILATRTNRKLKLWLCNTKDGTISFLSNLEFQSEINYLQPFMKSHENTIACSSEHGLLVWSLVDFSLTRNLTFEPCKACQANRVTNLSTDLNCRFILLHYSDIFLLHFAVHKNVFQLMGCKKNSPVLVNWKYPSVGKWPWSHRKPGMAAIVLNLDEGVCMSTRIAMFVGTQEKRIYCSFFDASDLDYDFEPNFGMLE